MASVGVIGLGTMGAPIARRLLAAGHDVSVFARRREAMAPLADAGARPMPSPAELAAVCDIVITMVLDGTAVEDVVLGAHGIIHGIRPDAVCVDHSTIDPDTARRVALALAERGVEMLDAPVSGGAAAAEAGELAVMAGGSEAAYARVLPVLQAYGRTVAHVGPSGAGQVAKACNQIATIVNTLAAAEAMLLAERAGVDPARILPVMLAGFAQSRMLGLQAPKMIARDFAGRVQSRLHHKDINIALDLAQRLGIDLPASRAAAAVWSTLQQRGGGHRDSAAVFEVLAGPWLPPQGFRHAVSLLLSGAVRRLPPDAAATQVQTSLRDAARQLNGLMTDLRASPEAAAWCVAEFERTLERLPHDFDRLSVLEAVRAAMRVADTPPPAGARDLFVVYAPEDRLPVAAPLAVELAKRRVSVAFSDFEVSTIEELGRALHAGLAAHTAGVILKSPAFIRLGLSAAIISHERLLVIDHPPSGELRAAQAAEGLARWVARVGR